MRRRVIHPLVAVAVLALVMSIPLSVQAQRPAPGAQTLRTDWGHPDLTGIWDRHSITPLERPQNVGGREFFTEKEIADLERQAILTNTDEARQEDKARDVGTAYNDFWWDRATSVTSKRTSLIVDPTDGRVPPLTPQAVERARLESSRAVGSLGTGGRGADSPEDRSLWERCITQGTPRLAAGAYNANMQIIQSPDYVVILHEQIHEARIVPLSNRPHLPANLQLWLGDSRGHWEGDTLVIETMNFSDKTNFRGSTTGLRMVERIRRTDSNTLDYKVTFSDPATWTRPWTVDMPMPKTKGEIYEYACHEGNYGLRGILAGARMEEKEAAAKVRTGSRQQ